MDYQNARNQEPYDLEFVIEAIRLHRKHTKKWPVKADGAVKWGKYEGKETWIKLASALDHGGRGLPKLTFAGLKKRIADEDNIDYRNIYDRKPLKLETVKNAVLLHYQNTGEWPKTQDSSFVKWGKYEGKETWKNLVAAINRGDRGLKKIGFVAFVQQVAEENGLHYPKSYDRSRLDLEKVKQAILLHYRHKNAWPTRKKEPVEYGEYKGKINWDKIVAAIDQGLRGLPKIGFAALKKQIAEEERNKSKTASSPALSSAPTLPGMN